MTANAENSSTNLAVKESTFAYQWQNSMTKQKWVEVLVDCPGLEGLYTYAVPPNLPIQIGDIVSIPFRQQHLGGIVIRWQEKLPAHLSPSQIKVIADVIAQGFFPPEYWQLMEQVAKYYCCELISVIKIALPPGILGKSQLRVRLKPGALPPGAENFCKNVTAKVLTLLKSQARGDYSSKYLQQQIPGARQGIQELQKRGWVETYLEPPKPPRPQLKNVISLIPYNLPVDVTPRQKEILDILRSRGGELWVNELLQIAKTSPSLLKKLQAKGCVVIEPRENLRLLQDNQPENDQPKQLTQAQAKALKLINSLSGWQQILLHGVTGSGKTEVYLQAIKPILARGKSALVLVPEIGLTPQLTDRFRARFGNQVWVYHSGLSQGERYDTWRQMLRGEPQVIIGTRSAVFAPLVNLGLIILDEEHDNSFKQTQPTPTYHARTVAKWRGKLANCPVILGSATPALETWQETSLGQSQYLCLPTRIHSRPLPPVEIVDMRAELKRGNRSIFSNSLANALKERQNLGQQAIIFISRRGHSTFVSCRSCGTPIECPHCDVSLAYHYTHAGANQLLRCHYCNYTTSQPSYCPECNSPYLKHFGTGTQRVKMEIEKQFPGIKALRFDGDTTRNKGARRRLLASFAQGEADVLIGTQMLTKGLDIPNVTLVGVLAADSLLHRSNYRAAETAFQTLTQVAGRAGRGDEPGKVIIQTYSPEHPTISAVKQHDYMTFIQTELPQREELCYPPYGSLVLIKFSGLRQAEVSQAAKKVAQVCLNQLQRECQLLGPAPASIMRVSNRYRWQILLKFPRHISPVLPDLCQLRRLCPLSVSLMIDVDPLILD